MAFKLVQNRTFKSKVTVNTPSLNGGFDISHFHVIFKNVNIPEIEELRKQGQADVLREVVAGWSDMVDDGGDVPFSAENLEALMLVPQAFEAVATAFWTSLFKAKEKN